MTRTIGTLLLLNLLAACGGAGGEPDNTVTAKLPAPEASEQPTALGPFPSASHSQSPTRHIVTQGAADKSKMGQPLTLGSSRYTSLEPTRCTPIANDGREASAERHRCAGSLGYTLETTDSGQWQSIALISPDGQRADLDVAKLANNARLGKTVEWRRDPSERPRALIMRVTGNPPAGAKDRVSDLVVTKLGAKACIVAVIPRGPHQNEKARAVADGEQLECMK
jgi:hypothetical protein